MKSPALRLIELVWEHEGKAFGGSRSRERTESSVREAVMLAISYGLRFDPNDFSRWSAFATEHAYGEACGHRPHGGRSYGVNRSACIAIEKQLGRQPWIMASIGVPSGHRLCTGEMINLYDATGTLVGGEALLITSFNDEKDVIRACTYYEEEELAEFHINREAGKALMGKTETVPTPAPERSTRQTPKRRVTITRDMLRENNAAIKRVTRERLEAEERRRADGERRHYGYGVEDVPAPVEAKAQ